MADKYVNATGLRAVIDWIIGKLSGKSDTGHTHAKSDITDMPTSLPANGGNADTATKLATARTINGTSFDGSANIRTANSWNLSLGASSNEHRYAIFARMSSSNPADNKGATLLVTDCGNFGGTLPGAWLIQISNRGSVPTMDVTVLRPHNSGGVTFGYYKDSTNGYFYFGVNTGYYRSDSNITVLRNTGVTIQKFSDNPTTPSGWTAATVRTLQDESGTIANATALTTSAGSATQPVYFSGGKPVACSYTLGKSVPSDAVFTDTNTWRGIQNNLTSDSTTDSLAAAQGKVLKGLVDCINNLKNSGYILKIKQYTVNCNGNDYATVTLPDNAYFICAHAYRTSGNNYHFITGYGHLMNTTTLFLYYDAKNTGDHLVSIAYLDLTS